MAESAVAPILTNAEDSTLKRLLNLFPQSGLKAAWSELRGHKDTIIDAIVAEKDYGAISNFVSDQFRNCKQHVYLFTHSATLQDLPTTLIPDLTPIPTVHVRAIIPGPQQRTDIYIAEAPYTVYLRDPLEELEVPHLWPMMIQVTDQFCLVRFVKLQRNLEADFKGRHIKSTPPPLTEDAVCRAVLVSLATEEQGSTVDLNSAIKTLLQRDMLDTDQVRSKDGGMTSTHELDSGNTIKNNLSPAQQQSMLIEPNLIKLKARVTGWDISISHFFCTPIDGFVNFSTYSEQGETDHVLREIIQNIQ